MKIRYIGRHQAGVFVSPDGDREVFVEHGGEVDLPDDVAKGLLGQAEADAGPQWESVKAVKAAKTAPPRRPRRPKQSVKAVEAAKESES